MNMVSRYIQQPVVHCQSPTLYDRPAVESVTDQTLAAVVENFVARSCKWQVYRGAHGTPYTAGYLIQLRGRLSRKYRYVRSPFAMQQPRDWTLGSQIPEPSRRSSTNTTHTQYAGKSYNTVSAYITCREILHLTTFNVRQAGLTRPERSAGNCAGNITVPTEPQCKIPLSLSLSIYICIYIYITVPEW